MSCRADGCLVRAGARLAFCLVDMNGGLGRVDGCLGVALEEPAIEVRVREQARGLSIMGAGASESWLRGKLSEYLNTTTLSGLSVEFKRRYEQHAGLGYSTQSLLAIGAGISAIRGEELDVRNWARVFGRGGTSGVGCWLFELGGFVLDGGHSFGAGQEKQIFAPSSVGRHEPAAVTVHSAVPSEWMIICARARRVRGMSGHKERAHFQEHCPVSAADVGDSCRTIVMELLPALAIGDLDLWNRGIARLQAGGFKKSIWFAQAKVVHELAREIRDAGLSGVGLSSFGPTVFAFVNSRDAGMVHADVCSRVKDAGIDAEVWITGVRNCGASVVAP